jgi:hypothetical protein
MKIHYDDGNTTHYGKVEVEIFEDIQDMIVRIVVSTTERTFIDITSSVCRWFKTQRVNYLISFFKLYAGKYYNPRFFNCPIKKGSFVAVKPRELIHNVNQYTPAFVPTKNNMTEHYNMTWVFKSRNGRTVKLLGTITEIFGLN